MGRPMAAQAMLSRRQKSEVQITIGRAADQAMAKDPGATHLTLQQRKLYSFEQAGVVAARPAFHEQQQPLRQCKQQT